LTINHEQNRYGNRITRLLTRQETIIRHNNGYDPSCFSNRNNELLHNEPAYIETHARRSDGNITETQSFSRQNHTGENTDGREIDNNADPDLQEILTRKPMPAQYIDLPARQPIRSNTDNELSTSAEDNLQTNNNGLSQLISTMQAMANQI
jgi:hypothetical protein